MEGTLTVSPTSRQLSELPLRLNEHTDFATVVAALREKTPASLDGVWGSSCALVAANLAGQATAPLVVVCPKQADLDDFRDDLALFSHARVVRFPAWESDPGERIVHDEIFGDRLRTLKTLLRDVDGEPTVVVTSIQSLLQPTPDPQAISGNARRVTAGQPLDGEELLRWLATHKFHHTSAVELPGEFSSRGGIVDVFAPDWELPVRIELFGDEVDSIRRFDVSTQRSLEQLKEIEITMLAPTAADSGHLADFLPPRAWFLLLEPEEAARQAAAFLERVERPGDFHSHPAAMARIGEFAHVTASSLASATADAHCTLQVESVQRFSGDVNRVREELETIGGEDQVVVVAQTDAESKRLSEIFRESPLMRQGRLRFHVGRLREGFRLRGERIVLIGGGQMFHRADLRRTPTRRLGKAIDNFLDLKEGDLVVHLGHGIGRYRGLKPLEKLIEGVRQVEEHLEIEFHGGTRVYVPSTNIDLVQKYVGGRKSRPTLARVGGKSWLKQKKAAESAVVDLALELLDLQAAREAKPGIAIAGDSDWQRAFDASFPYHETDDQLAAISAIKEDMQRARPMDRLLCGDVGYGKTEMAIRAAFKAIDNGYQVAVLVPTTILAEQHFHTFRERMAEFPFAIERLSRFCGAAEQRTIVNELAAGNVDLVVGTHRLTSKDVSFANLGLVIIDEEQRFGVEVKERLKALRTSVDVLTMTATPIPRTLHMSLVGMRDISNLQTPPEDRIAVETRVARFNEEMIRHAVLRELNRGGQIYFVHNRVNDIEVLAQKLKRIAPEASMRIGHGQMPEHDLEQVMVDFVAGRFDMLLATTIVESGLDIPNANTIFIDEADRYGLSDLHQLRGRVGRYKHRAYCYLMIDPGKHVSPNAARRLRAIEEFSNMGAGFAIAMRDLEIRGAGNILGTRQSGHIAAVGYELYCQLLESAVRRLKKMPPKLTVDVEVDLPGEAYLPDDYVPDMRLKIDLYRRLTRVTSDDDLKAIREDMIDRFGRPTEAVERMLSLAALKLDAAIWRINSIRMEGRYLVFGYTDRGRIEQLSRLKKGKLRVVDGESAYATLAKGAVDSERILRAVKSVLRPS
jgi:transcription-repair coupling factor (superfamily II helicase)